MPPRLLIAEDSLTQREVLRSLLQEAGYDVDVARDGREGAERLAQRSYAMLISDIVMPNMDGYALCREAKRLQPQLPVILLTSMNDPLDVVHVLQAGADNFLRKPYEHEQLLARVESMLVNQQRRAEGQHQAGVELFFLDQRFMITAERQQILDLLVATFEELVHTNERLREEEAALTSVWDGLSAQLAEAQAQRADLAAALRAVPEAVVVVDLQGAVTAASEAYAQLTGAPGALSLRGAPADPLRLLWRDGADLEPRERPASRAAAEARVVNVGDAVELLAERADGSRVPVLVRAAPVVDDSGAPTGVVQVVRERDPHSR